MKSKPDRTQYDVMLAMIRREMWQDDVKFGELKNNLAIQCRSFEERWNMLANVARQGFQQLDMTNYQQVAMYNAIKEAVATGKPNMELFAAIMRDVEGFRTYLAEEEVKQKNEAARQKKNIQ